MWTRTFFLIFTLFILCCTQSLQAASLQDDRIKNLTAICGKSELNQESTSNITTALAHGDYPWLAAVYNQEKFICSGVLISANTVLTPAHCVTSYDEKIEKFSVHLGQHDLSDRAEKNTVKIEIKSIVIHPDYTSGSGQPDADLALLQLSEPVEFSKFIRPVCLWDEPTDLSLIVGESATLAGWDLRESLQVPKKVQQDIVSTEACLLSSPVFSGITSARTLCAGMRNDEGLCLSGNPLVLKRNGRWILRGLLAFGLSKNGICDLSNYLVYTDIAMHLSWLSAAMVV